MTRKKDLHLLLAPSSLRLRCPFVCSTRREVVFHSRNSLCAFPTNRKGEVINEGGTTHHLSSLSHFSHFLSRL